jgi:hypothetical protein
MGVAFDQSCQRAVPTSVKSKAAIVSAAGNHFKNDAKQHRFPDAFCIAGGAEWRWELR